MVPSLPSSSFVKLAKMLRQHDTLMALEKTAEVGDALVHREEAILSSFYKLAAFSPVWREVDATPGELTALSLIEAGAELLKVASLAVDPLVYEEEFTKLATIGAINAKLRSALSDPQLSYADRNEVVKLGMENNLHCITVLKTLAFEKRANMFGNAMGKVKNFFSPGTAGSSMQAGLNKAVPKTTGTMPVGGGQVQTPKFSPPPPPPPKTMAPLPAPGSTVAGGRTTSGPARSAGMNIDANRANRVKFK